MGNKNNFKFTKEQDFCNEISSRWKQLQKHNYNSFSVKDKDLKDFYSEEMILATSIMYAQQIFPLIKGHSYGSYLKLLRALGQTIMDSNLSPITRFDYEIK